MRGVDSQTSDAGVCRIQRSETIHYKSDCWKVLSVFSTYVEAGSSTSLPAVTKVDGLPPAS
eukprot:8075344-Pyramimonas_sp.AAC.1